MEAMEEFMAQQKQADIDRDQMDGSVRKSSPHLVASYVERSLVTTPREEEAHVPRMVRKKLAWCLG